MELFQVWIAPIVLGAIIGYFTNYLAIKMLFRPKRAWYLGKHRVPFTPGIIPKNKDRLARAVGQAVGEKLLTRSDIKEQLLHGAVRRAFVDTAVNELQGAQMSLHALAQDAIGETSYQTVKTALVDYICDRVKDGFSKLDLEQLLCNGSRTLLQQGNFLSLFLNENTMQTFAPPIAQAMRDYVDQNGETLLKPVIMQEVEQIGAQSTKDLTSHFRLNEAFVHDMLDHIYEHVVREKADTVLENFDISLLVEQRILQMDTDQIEELVMSVMERELKAVISLGALLGALIGALNILINRL